MEIIINHGPEICSEFRRRRRRRRLAAQTRVAVRGAAQIAAGALLGGVLVLAVLMLLEVLA